MWDVGSYGCTRGKHKDFGKFSISEYKFRGWDRTTFSFLIHFVYGDQMRNGENSGYSLLNC